MKETIIDQSLGAYDTPKKQNRSAVEIPQGIVDQLENGEFTNEMIDELAKKFPIFRYRTCITIHGDWPSVSRSRIGGYKNVHQNQNGSVEVFYSAIDIAKMVTIKKIVQPVSKWRFIRNSSSRKFVLTQGFNTKEEFEILKTQASDLKQRMLQSKMRGKVHVWAYSMFGSKFIDIDIYPYSIPESDVMNTALLMLGMTQDQYNQKLIAVNEEQARLRKESDDANNENERLRGIQHELMIEKYHVLYKKIEHLPVIKNVPESKSGVLLIVCKGAVGPKSHADPMFRMVKVSPGSFGRVKLDHFFTGDYNDPNPVFTKMCKAKTKDELQSFLNNNDVRIWSGFDNIVKKPAEKSPSPKPIVFESDGVEIVEYSEKSFALFGESTRVIKDELAKHGTFNRHLKYGDGKAQGWIFSNKKRDTVLGLIGKN